MEAHITTIVSAGVLSLALSLPANAGEKITGRTSAVVNAKVPRTEVFSLNCWFIRVLP
jgi:hypothetical protein